jgi:hypothetical protein
LRFPNIAPGIDDEAGHIRNNSQSIASYGIDDQVFWWKMPLDRELGYLAKKQSRKRGDVRKSVFSV